MMLKAVAFDWGHTVMDESRDGGVPLDARPIHLMPGVLEVLPQIGLPLAAARAPAPDSLHVVTA